MYTETQLAQIISEIFGPDSSFVQMQIKQLNTAYSLIILTQLKLLGYFLKMSKFLCESKFYMVNFQLLGFYMKNNLLSKFKSAKVRWFSAISIPLIQSVDVTPSNGQIPLIHQRIYTDWISGILIAENQQTFADSDLESRIFICE